MAAAIDLPNALYLLLALAQPDDLWLIGIAVGIARPGYGFGFTAYLLYMLYVARGPHSTAHCAICTGCMSLGRMLPGMVSGWLQEFLGYRHFFAWILVATLPSFLVAAWFPLTPASAGVRRHNRPRDDPVSVTCTLQDATVTGADDSSQAETAVWNPSR